MGEASRVSGVSCVSEELVVLLGLLLVRRACGLPTWLSRYGLGLGCRVREKPLLPLLNRVGLDVVFGDATVEAKRLSKASF